MADHPRVLHLYTLYFPQGERESFIKAELPFLSNSFDTVKIFPKVRTEEAFIALPSNVEVEFIDSDDERVGILPRLRSMGANLLKRTYLGRVKEEAALIGQTLKRSKKLSAYIQANEEAIHYSYWLEEWSIILGELFRDGMIKGHVSRAHGFDLYDERNPLGYHPYRKLQLRGLKKIFAVSRVGEEYLKARLSGVPISTAYLGTQDHGMGPEPETRPLRLVSLARMVPLKRIDEIVNVLRQCTIEIQWTHIGDGPEFDTIKEAASTLPENISTEFRGKMSHEQVMDLFRTLPFHVLISLSETEGLPVSMMEAISFGIPILSTDVGGVKEIVTKETGVLVDPELDIKAIAGMIDDWQLTDLDSTEFRLGVRSFWEQHYAATSNYTSFVEELIALHCS